MELDGVDHPFPCLFPAGSPSSHSCFGRILSGKPNWYFLGSVLENFKFTQQHLATILEGYKRSYKPASLAKASNETRPKAVSRGSLSCKTMYQTASKAVLVHT